MPAARAAGIFICIDVPFSEPASRKCAAEQGLPIVKRRNSCLRRTRASDCLGERLAVGNPDGHGALDGRRPGIGEHDARNRGILRELADVQALGGDHVVRRDARIQSHRPFGGIVAPHDDRLFAFAERLAHFGGKIQRLTAPARVHIDVRIAVITGIRIGVVHERSAVLRIAEAESERKTRPALARRDSRGIQLERDGEICVSGVEVEIEGEAAAISRCVGKGVVRKRGTRQSARVAEYGAEVDGVCPHGTSYYTVFLIFLQVKNVPVS